MQKSLIEKYFSLGGWSWFVSSLITKRIALSSKPFKIPFQRFLQIHHRPNDSRDINSTRAGISGQKSFSGGFWVLRATSYPNKALICHWGWSRPFRAHFNAILPVFESLGSPELAPELIDRGRFGWIGRPPGPLATKIMFIALWNVS